MIAARLVCGSSESIKENPLMPKSCGTMDTLEKFRVCAMNYRIIIGLDIEELVMDDRYNEMGGGTWQSMYYEIFGNSYEEILADGSCLYDALGFMIYLCVCQLKYETTEVYDLIDEEYGKCMLGAIDFLRYTTIRKS
jgi:hypothetical protein